ncbi:MAG: hypothetical protein AAB886_01365 [Patescibacteria group bacterium]
MNKQLEDKKNLTGKETKDFLVSVMPKEYRGKEGLMRQPWNGAASAQPKQNIVLTPKPAPTEPITPTKLDEQKLEQAPIPQSKKSLWVILFFGAVLLIGVGIGAFFILRPEKTAQPVQRPPVVRTVPVLPPASTTQPAETPKPPAVPKTPDPFAGEALPGRDSDSDGLTDVEEVLYGTIATRPDTDADGFLDGNEVFHLYHPNGQAPQTLLDTGFVTWLSMVSFNYRVQAPKRWTQKVNEERKELFVTSPTGESFQIVKASITGSDSIEQWYAAQSEVASAPLEPFRTKQGFEGAWTPDHLTGYVRFADTELLIFTYQLGQARRVEYRQTFEMFLNSLEKIAP